ncbi:putative outer membrane efflux protein [Microscilla marina ATCC 23134]|uniref:Putative outer membrane efflux protein n=2 Tax=Microscilla marina TaxID=1027 RepID=A1ZFV2_MICM2|nr:putative outer membrane efflux protein [Microscilla marina ATCC 23134]
MNNMSYLHPFTRKNLRFALLLSIGMLGAFGLRAQGQPENKTTKSSKWSIQKCIDHAIEHNIDIKQNALTIKTNEYNVQQSKLARYPSVNASATQGLNFGRSIDPTTNEFINTRVLTNNFSLDASVTLYNGGRLQKTVKRDLKNIEISKLDLKATTNTVSLNIATSYLDVLLNQELLTAAQQQVASTKEQLTRTEKLLKAGSVAENEVINLRATLANDELQVVTSENNVNLARLRLMQLMNLPSNESFEVEQIDVENLVAQPHNETPAQIFDIAKVSQPTIKSALLSVENSEMSINIAKADRYPTLTLGAGVLTRFSDAGRLFQETGEVAQTPIGFVNGTNQTVVRQINVTEEQPYTFGQQLSDNLTQYVSLRLSIPIFNGGQVNRNISTSIIQKRQAELTVQNRKNQLRQDIEQAYNNAKASQNSYQARKKLLESRELAFDIAKKRFNAGAMNSVDFNLAKIDRDRAQSDMIRAKYDYLFRTEVLNFYMDKPLDFK